MTELVVVIEDPAMIEPVTLSEDPDRKNPPFARALKLSGPLDAKSVPMPPW